MLIMGFRLLGGRGYEVRDIGGLAIEQRCTARSFAICISSRHDGHIGHSPSANMAIGKESET